LASRKTTSPKKTAAPAKAATPRKPAASRSAAAKSVATKTVKASTTTKGAKAPRKTPARAKATTAAKKPAARKTAPRGKKAPVVTEVEVSALEAPAAALAAAKIAAEAALDKKAENVVILDVAGLTGYADCFVIATGTSDRQVSAIADSIEEKMKKAGHRPIGVEGHGLGHWVLLDFGDVVAHVFYEEARALYDVEGLWADARRIPVE